MIRFTVAFQNLAFPFRRRVERKGLQPVQYGAGHAFAAIFRDQNPRIVQVINTKKTLSGPHHPCPHGGTLCARNDNTARVLLRWMETRLAGTSGSGREPSEVWSGGCFTGMKHETRAVAV